MATVNKSSRRKFVATTVSAAALSSLPTMTNFPTLEQDKASLPALEASISQSDASSPWKNQGILGLRKSPHAKLRNVPIRAVSLLPGFWGQRRQTNLEKSIPSMEKLLLAHGRVDNFRRLTGKSNAPQRGPVYSDSDIYKWLEAVGFALQSGNPSSLRDQASQIIADIIAAQEPGGYLGTYYVADRHRCQHAPRCPPCQRSRDGGHLIGRVIRGRSSGSAERHSFRPLL